MENKEESRILREAGKKATAVVTSAALLLGGVFHEAGELPEREEEEAPIPVVEMLAPDTDPGDDGDGSEELEEEDKKKRGSARVRWLARMPAPIRALAAVPVWALGCSLLSILAAALTGGISPILRTLLMFLGLSGVLVGAFCAAKKALFPDIPLKKLLSRKSFRGLLLGALGIGVLEGVVLWRFPGKGNLTEWLRLLGSMSVLSAVTAVSFRREKRRREKEEEQKAEEAAAAALPQETDAERDRRRVMEALESVSRRY